MKKIVLDMDSSVSETYGRQEGTAYNGHFGCICYHPLFCFNQYGNLEYACSVKGTCTAPRTGRLSWIPSWPGIVTGIFSGISEEMRPSPIPVYSYLEAEHYWYAIRLPSNDILNREIGHLMTRPVGRPPKAPIVLYHEFKYRAAAWDRQRRVIAKVEWHRGELFPRVGFIVTNLHWTRRALSASTTIGEQRSR